VLQKSRLLDKLRGTRKYLIKVDGGINSENIEIAREAGADVFVVGSYLFSATDRTASIAELKAKSKQIT
jgi:ribulose-phosphate 3-epimerase